MTGQNIKSGSGVGVTKSPIRLMPLALASTFVLSANAFLPLATMAVESGRTIAAKPFQVRITREVVRADQLMLQGKYTEAADLYKTEMGRAPKSVAATVGCATHFSFI